MISTFNTPEGQIIELLSSILHNGVGTWNSNWFGTCQFSKSKSFSVLVGKDKHLFIIWVVFYALKGVVRGCFSRPVINQSKWNFYSLFFMTNVLLRNKTSKLFNMDNNLKGAISQQTGTSSNSWNLTCVHID